MTGPPAAETGFDAGWLALREPADAAARSRELVRRLRAALGGGPVRVHDLGAGTGSMPRWLAPLLPNPQRWTLHDHDPALLAAAARGCAGLRDGSGDPVPVRTRRTDLTRLTPGELAADDAGTPALVTASALLDLLTAPELDRLVDACAAAGAAVLCTLSVSGRVALDPPADRDRAFAAAFDAHQRRTVAGRRLLGPDAPAAAAAAFARHGLAVHAADSPWRLGPERAELVGRWLRGWVGAAVEHEPELGPVAADYLRRRLHPGARLTAVVWHRDLLALPIGSPPGAPIGTAQPGTRPE